MTIVLESNHSVSLLSYTTIWIQNLDTAKPHKGGCGMGVEGVIGLANILLDKILYRPADFRRITAI